jgi:hypothetical protein
MRWQVTIKDGGLWIAKKRGVEERLMLIESDYIDNDTTKKYFTEKRDLLLTALDKKETPELCRYEERWQGRRCKGSNCDVHMFCLEGSKINKVKLEE